MNKKVFIEYLKKSYNQIINNNIDFIRERKFELLADLIIKDLGKSLANKGYSELINKILEKQRAGFKLQKAIKNVQALDQFKQIFEEILKKEWDFMVIKSITEYYLKLYKRTIDNVKDEKEQRHFIDFIRDELKNHGQKESEDYIKEIILDVLKKLDEETINNCV